MNNNIFKFQKKIGRKISIIHQFLFIFYFIIKIKIFHCNSCKTANTLGNTECFNNIIIFRKNYRSGCFAKTRNGDMVIEFSYNYSRLFYGLKANGENFFEEGPIKEIETIQSIDNAYNRLFAKNIFISFQSNGNEGKQYLFSTSDGNSLTELHDFESNNYIVKLSEKFIGNQIISNQYILLETQINNQNYYFCIYTHFNETKAGFYTIKKFAFTSFTMDSYYNKEFDTFEENLNTEIISAININEYQILAVFYIGYKNKIYVTFYDYDLNIRGGKQEIHGHIIGLEIFFKSIYLGNYISALSFFSDENEGDSLIFGIYKIIKLNETVYSKERLFFQNFSKNRYYLKSNFTLNDFVKINNERAAFISTQNYTTLFIILLDLYNDVNNIRIRVYNFNLEYNVTKELSGFVYNDYLVFSSTIDSSPDGKYLSMLMIFGYANGTDMEIDISPYFNDTDDFDNNNNIINQLQKGLTIDNNIFGYIPANQIKLISIPEQIIFYNGDDSTQLLNGSILEFNHKLKQKNDLIKNNDYYSFEFQFIIEEPDFNTFYKINTFDNLKYDVNNSADNNISFEPKKFYGKINKATFKLCYIVLFAKL